MAEFYDTLRRQLTLHEGRKNKPYRCTAGKLTIGVGRNLDDVGLSEDEIDFLLTNDIKRCEKDLQRNLPWYEKQPDTVKMVLIDMCFNMGIGGLLKFKNTLGMIERGEYKEAAAEMLISKWSIQVGDRGLRLSRMMYDAK